jgi:hypothetical protein
MESLTKISAILGAYYMVVDAPEKIQKTLFFCLWV